MTKFLSGEKIKDVVVVGGSGASHYTAGCQQCRAGSGLYLAERLFSVLCCPAWPLEILEIFTISGNLGQRERERPRANRGMFPFKSLQAVKDKVATKVVTHHRP